MGVKLAKKVDDKTCRRCRGKGRLDQYAHIMHGICFRCWGAGTDPKTIEALEAWLAKARRAYVVRRDALQAGRGDRTTEAELNIIVKQGKSHRRRLDRLKAAMAIGKATAGSGAV